MTGARLRKSMEKLRRELPKYSSFAEALENVASLIREKLEVDLVYIEHSTAGASVQSPKSYSALPLQQLVLSVGEEGAALNNEPVELPLMVSETRSSLCAPKTLSSLSQAGVLSLLLVPIYDSSGSETVGFISAAAIDLPIEWKSEECALLQYVSDIVGMTWERFELRESVSKERDIKNGETPKSVQKSEGERLLRRVLRDTPHAVLEIDRKLHVRAANDSALVLAKIDSTSLPERLMLDEFLGAFLNEEYTKSLLEEFSRLVARKAERRSFRVREQGRSSSKRSFFIDFESLSASSFLISVKDISSDRLMEAELEKARSQFRKLARYGNIIFIRTDPSLKIQEILGDVERILGRNTDELGNLDNLWEECIHADDLRELGRQIRRMGGTPHEIASEIRVLNRSSGEQRWLMLRAVPIFDQSGSFRGWEGYGVDISDKREAEQNLSQQGRRLRALYEVAQSVQSIPEPSQAVLKGLQALIKATGSEAGAGFLYSQKDGKLEVVAAQGLSAQYIQDLESIVLGPSLVQIAVETREGELVDNLPKEMRAGFRQAKAEGLKSTIVAPILSDGEVLGAIAIFCKRVRAYEKSDLELVEAACRQIGLASRFALSVIEQRKEADALKLLYSLSHDLSSLITPREVAETAFSYLDDIVDVRRVWLGVLNEQGTHIVGQAGSGPDLNQKILSIQIELSKRHEFLDEALRERKAKIIDDVAAASCSGLTSLLERLGVEQLAVFPLIALGRVVGVCALEVEPSMKNVLRARLPLLTSVFSEVANVLLARRLEGKISEAEKMRMAGVLASGVAHNFNNLLQAVMGQASLIEMQLPTDSPLREAADRIVDSASRGAGLIKQLLSFSMQDGGKKRPTDMRSFFSESKQLYKSLLGDSIELKYELGGSGTVHADTGQLQQVLTNVLINAKEALAERERPFVRVRTEIVHLESGEIEPGSPPGRYFRVDVEDNGKGMDLERQRRCFEPFFTTKNVDNFTGLSVSGSGLGLASAYSIVRQHSGMMRVSSAVGEGSIFSIFFPIAKAPENRGYVEGTEQILLVDVEDSSAYALKSSLDSLGLNCRIISDVDLAIRELGADPHATKMVLVDAERVEPQVEKFVRNVFSKDVDTYCVLSSVDQEKYADLAKEFPKLRVVEKPLGLWAIQSLVRDILPEIREAGLKSQIEVEKERAEGELSSQSDDGNNKGVSVPKENIH